MNADTVHREPDQGAPSLASLAGLLAFFLLPGAACAVYLWHVLNRLLTGHPLTGGEAATGLVVLVAFLGLLTGLGYVLRRIGSDGSPAHIHGAGEGTP